MGEIFILFFSFPVSYLTFSNWGHSLARITRFCMICLLPFIKTLSWPLSVNQKQEAKFHKRTELYIFYTRSSYSVCVCICIHGWMCVCERLEMVSVWNKAKTCTLVSAGSSEGFLRKCQCRYQSRLLKKYCYLPLLAMWCSALMPGSLITTTMLINFNSQQLFYYWICFVFSWIWGGEFKVFICGFQKESNLAVTVSHQVQINHAMTRT